MLSAFQNHIKSNRLFQPTDKILLAVSGGKDSMAMLHLFVAAKFNIGVAHCNFQLRDKAADEDELFVQQTCQQLDIPFHSIRFDTAEYAEKNKISTQMAARELRYNWFEEIKNTYHYHFIATAHHQNDVAETMLINLTKGSGLSGLHGIKTKNNHIIRPLLCFTSDEIQQYIFTYQISYREDQSNTSVKYVRNKIRHKVLPKLVEINPNIIESLNKTARHFSATENILMQKIEAEKKRCFTTEKELVKINIEHLQQLHPLATYLYYFLLPYHFNFDDCEQIVLSLDKNSGKQFFSTTHQLIKDRAFLLLSPKTAKQPEPIIINTVNDFSKSPINIKFELIKNENITFKTAKNIAYLDAVKIAFPLCFRKWKEGDRFTPFGMKSKKKLSDYFIDEKFSIPEKETTWLLTDKNDNIIWVVNSRTDNNFKVNSTTKTILLLETY
ncbi:MAG: tRNA lysidine(34) synthetase TilS [Vicingaceae bacterium]|nr:tRNA lysidine(34) synthetase TilS [Flavobacteriales bacterium]MDF1674294.1 tRNA lysidine(34) synthetase TilS [Vicingaceae bacterium]|tara:strand:- start:62653 stop:63975 length:1323 start_codon:yes stop_codon:yes gene_type:complete